MILTLTTVVVYVVEQKRNIDIGQFLLFLNLKRCDFFWTTFYDFSRGIILNISESSSKISVLFRYIQGSKA